MPKWNIFPGISSISFFFFFFLLVVDGSTIGLRAVHFEETPLNSVAFPGDTVYFNCKTNVTKDHVGWLHNGRRIRENDDAYVITKNYLSFQVGRDSNTYSNQIGEYQCVGGNGVQVSLPASLSIAELCEFPSIKPRIIEAFEGNDVIVDCRVPYSNPPGFVQYFLNDTLVPVRNDDDDDDHDDHDDDDNNRRRLHAEIINGELLFLKDVSSKYDSGNYTCTVQNHITGEKKYSTSTVILIVHRPSSTLSSNRREKTRLIYRPNEFYNVRQGENVTIPCIATGYPKPRITWTRFDGRPLPFSSSDGIRRIFDADPSQSGTFMCTVFNGARRFVRKTTLTVQTRPTFVRVPLESVTIKDGDPLSLFCSGKGTPEPRIRWYHNGQWKGNESEFRIRSVRRRHDSGWYQCMISNSIGGDTTSVFVRIRKDVDDDNGDNDDNSDDDDDDDDNDNSSSSDDIYDNPYRDTIPFLPPPSKPNVSQLSEDSAMISWTLPENSQLPVSFFKIQFREFRGKNRSGWRTLDDVIDPKKRDFEILGLDSNRRYRFRIVAVYANNDDKQGPLSKKFKFNNKRIRKGREPPRIVPIITEVLPLDSTSLKVGWKLAQSFSNVEGYFIYYKSDDQSEYNKITIIGGSSHSYVIEDLKPGIKYELRVQAFNFAGVSPVSKVVRRNTRFHETLRPIIEGKKVLHNVTFRGSSRSNSDSASSATSSSSSSSTTTTTTLMDDQVTFYLLIGGALALLLLAIVACCSVTSYVQKKRAIKAFSATNVAIHEKYVDASLSAHRSQDDNPISLADVHPPSLQEVSKDSSSHVIQTCETSFSNRGCSSSSSSSSVIVNGSLGFEEYTDEPSGTSWRRKRRSEEIL